MVTNREEKKRFIKEDLNRGEEKKESRRYSNIAFIP